MKLSGCLLLRCYLCLAGLCLAIPVISMMWGSFAGVQSELSVAPFAAHWYGEAWNNIAIGEGLTTSLIVGCSVAALSTILALIGSYWLCRCNSQTKLSSAYVAMVSLPCFVPLLLSAMAMLMYFQTVQLSGSIAAIIAAHTCYCSPFALSIVRLSYERLNPDLEQAARNLGAGNFKTVTSVTLPQIWPAIIAAGLLSFLVSWDEFTMSWFVGGFTKTLPMVLYDMIGSSYNPSINAVGTLVIVSSGLVLFCVLMILDRSLKVTEVKQS